jgi:zinc protease
MVVLGIMVVAGVAAACGSSSVVRFGSLVRGDRSILYKPGVESFSLPNGLTVALVPDDRANLVSVDVRYLVGAADDPPGKAGLAHLVEHAMFDQRAAPGGPTLQDRLGDATLRFNAVTTLDATHFDEVALAPRLDDLLAIEATRMAVGCHGIDEPTFERERAVVIQEAAQRGPHELRDAIHRAVFGASHAYARDPDDGDLAALTLDDVCRFVDAYYGPERAILVIGGRIDPRAQRDGIRRRFGPLHRRATAARTPVRPVVLTGGTTELHADTEHAFAMVVFPDARWGSDEAITDNLVDGLVAQAIAELDSTESWVTGFDVGHVGGMRAGARYFAVSVADPARLDDAVAQIFRITDELAHADSAPALSVLGIRRQTELLDGFESVADRGMWCADYLQFADHHEFHVRELKALSAIDFAAVRARAGRLIRGASQMLRVLPSKAPIHTARAQLHAAARIDLPVWHAAVDPAEAERAIALPVERRPAAVSELRLDNGLRVVMASDFTQPVVEARLVFPVGATGAGPEQAAVALAAAKLLDHNFVRGYSAGDHFILEWVMGLGARLSASVDDHTTFRVRGSSIFADWHVWRLHWLLENGIYLDADLTRVREAAARDAEHDTGQRDDGASRRQALREAVFGRDHPYARAAGALASVARLSTDDLYRFRDAHYRASGATLIIVGNFDARAMRRTVTELFGAWSGAPPPAVPPIPAFHPAAGPRWIVHADPDASQVRITVMFVASSPRVPSRAARAVVASMVGNRLQLVRTRLGASYGIHAGYGMSEAGDVFEIDGFVDVDRAGEVARQIQADLDGLRAGDATLAADFVRARRSALTQALADPVKASAVADDLEAAVANRLAIDAAAMLPAAIATTTLAAAREVIGEDLQPARMVVLLSGRPADTAAALAAAGVDRVERVPEARAAAH